MKLEEAIEVLRRLPIGLMNLSCEQKSDLTEAQPAIDLESLRPTAHWVHKQTKLPGGLLPVEECSLCECQAWHKTSFCPHCGARMKMED